MYIKLENQSLIQYSGEEAYLIGEFPKWVRDKKEFFENIFGLNIPDFNNNFRIMISRKEIDKERKIRLYFKHPVKLSWMLQKENETIKDKKIVAVLKAKDPINKTGEINLVVHEFPIPKHFSNAIIISSNLEYKEIREEKTQGIFVQTGVGWDEWEIIFCFTSKYDYAGHLAEINGKVIEIEAGNILKIKCQERFFADTINIFLLCQ